MTNFDPAASVKDRLTALNQLIADLTADSQPILLGPFRSEMGFEVSYWTAFVLWLSKQVPGFEKRAYAITRGGLGRLYPNVAGGHDLYALRDVKDIRRENLWDQKQQKVQKQLTPTAWDEAVLLDAAHALGLGTVFHTVHPAWMYWLGEPYWSDQQGLGYLLNFTDYALMPKPAKPKGLPEKYVAVKFYARHTFPAIDGAVTEFVKRTVSVLASQTQVVLLNTGSEYDDHADFMCAGPNVLNLPQLAPETNLLTIASVMAHATAYVGTYGGGAQMALRMGVPSVSFWKNYEGTATSHHYLSWWLSKKTHVPFLTGSIADADLWAQLSSVPVVQAVQKPEAVTV